MSDFSFERNLITLRQSLSEIQETGRQKTSLQRIWSAAEKESDRRKEELFQLGMKKFPEIFQVKITLDRIPYKGNRDITEMVRVGDRLFLFGDYGLVAFMEKEEGHPEIHEITGFSQAVTGAVPVKDRIFLFGESGERGVLTGVDRDPTICRLSSFPHTIISVATGGEDIFLFTDGHGIYRQSYGEIRPIPSPGFFAVRGQALSQGLLLLGRNGETSLWTGKDMVPGEDFGGRVHQIVSFHNPLGLGSAGVARPLLFSGNTPVWGEPLTLPGTGWVAVERNREIFFCGAGGEFFRMVREDRGWEKKEDFPRLTETVRAMALYSGKIILGGRNGFLGEVSPDEITDWEKMVERYRKETGAFY